jgi:hypothetical protein
MSLPGPRVDDDERVLLYEKPMVLMMANGTGGGILRP